MQTVEEPVYSGPRFSPAVGKKRRKKLPSPKLEEADDSDLYEDDPPLTCNSALLPGFGHCEAHDNDDPSLCAGMERISVDDALAHAEEECLRRGPDPTTPAQTKRSNKEAYVVFYGWCTGIFTSWPAAAKQIRNFENACWKGYYTFHDVVEAWKHALANDLVGPQPLPAFLPSPMPVICQRTHSPHKCTNNPQPLPASYPVPSSTSLPHKRTNNTDSFLTDLASLRAPSNEECWWVVVRGNYPGVYLGMSAARAAVGSYPNPFLYKHTLGESSACKLFVHKFMAGEVHH
ncbi:hypothetical protein C0992_010307 [Termitomyces sp. T32_za158]|nr:hypothetical protein C0992_010307 [Termitomyces sp. T32_za158]